MAFKAQSISKDKSGDVEGAGKPRTFGSVTVTGKMTTFAGDPPAALLADDSVRVQSLSGAPWPRSFEDRRGKVPGQMELRELRGEWPDAREKQLQAFAEAKLAKPLEVGVALLTKQGVKRDDATRHVAAVLAGATTNIPDPSVLLAESGARK